MTYAADKIKADLHVSEIIVIHSVHLEQLFMKQPCLVNWMSSIFSYSVVSFFAHRNTHF